MYVQIVGVFAAVTGWFVVSRKLLAQFAIPAPLDPGAPLAPDVPEEPLVPEEPDDPELPLDPEDPLVPEDPSPPLAPARFTCQIHQFPEPTTTVGVSYTKTPVVGLYDITKAS